MESNENGNLTISRKKSFCGMAIDIHIEVDQEKFNLSNGQAKSLNIDVGEHIIKYKVWNRREKSVTLNVESNKQYKINFKYDALWGGFKIAKDSVLN